MDDGGKSPFFACQPGDNTRKLSMLLTMVMLEMGITSQALSADTGRPPLRYSLNQTGISVHFQPSDALEGGYKIELNGNGNSFYQPDGQVAQTVQIAPATLLALINGFYKSHFFDLIDIYSSEKQVDPKDGSTVVTVVQRFVDTGSTNLCIRLADYKKCISVIDCQPAVSVDLIDKIKRQVPIGKPNP